MSRLKLFVLYGAVLLPALVYVQGYFGDHTNGKLLPAPLMVLSTFPAPFVFNEPGYLYRREITFTLADQSRITLDQAEILKHAYVFEHRFAGVLLWHFLKYSPHFDASFNQGALRLFFCQDGQALDLLQPSQNVVAVKYDFEEDHDGRGSVSTECARP
jgi:hypothetical protein